MTKNPLINALAAILYITAVAMLMFYGDKNIGPMNYSIVGPIAAISLFTLSAAMMGFLFFYQPFQLYTDGKKKAAIDLSLKTLAIFAIITIITFIVLFSGVLSNWGLLKY